jgi:hypothetical protein
VPLLQATPRVPQTLAVGSVAPFLLAVLANGLRLMLLPLIGKQLVVVRRKFHVPAERFKNVLCADVKDISRHIRH